jgi:hypothetical protein
MNDPVFQFYGHKICGTLLVSAENSPGQYWTLLPVCWSVAIHPFRIFFILAAWMMIWILRCDWIQESQNRVASFQWFHWYWLGLDDVIWSIKSYDVSEALDLTVCCCIFCIPILIEPVISVLPYIRIMCIITFIWLIFPFKFPSQKEKDLM